MTTSPRPHTPRYAAGDFFTDHYDDDPCTDDLSPRTAALIGFERASCRVRRETLQERRVSCPPLAC